MGKTMKECKKTQLQIALDAINLEDAAELLEKTGSCLDVIEIGTPMMMRYGMYAVTEMKKRFPHHTILCDSKIMDAGSYETGLVCSADADILTVLAVTDICTIAECIRTAHAAGKKVMADLICISDIEKASKTLLKQEVDIIGIHTGIDQQAEGRTPLEDLRLIRSCCPDAVLSVAGGINADNVDEYLKYDPDIVISGEGIVKAENPVSAAEKMAEKLAEWNHRRT